MDISNISQEELVIKKYQEDEQVMIQLFVAWCINHKLHPNELYSKAYPDQPENPSLLNVLKEMDDMEPIQVGDETMLDVLQMFGNDDLAFVVSDEILRLEKKQA